jgi:hypothetical protein
MSPSPNVRKGREGGGVGGGGGDEVEMVGVTTVFHNQFKI